MEYFDISPELIEHTSRTINWFKDNKKNLIDHLSEEKFPFSIGGNSYSSAKDAMTYHFWTFNRKNELPRDIKEQLIELWKYKQVFFAH